MRISFLSKLSAWLIVLLCFFYNAALAQRSISGRVTDERGGGISGVTVTVKGTTTATQTDANGNFSINAPESGVLVFSSVGYGSREVNISGTSSFDISMVAQNQSMQEVVVIGYGTARRKDVTGSVSSVNARDFNRGAQVSPDQLIQGKVAGVQVLNNSGQPGGAVSVRIRGNASIRSGNQPLYVVDGVPLDNRSARPGLDAEGIGQTPDANPLNFINPNDIASIDVLKDASAAAIYGSRGANGVVIITTKKGQSGQPRVDLNISAGVSNVMKQLEVLNASEYRQALNTYSLASATTDWGSDVDAFDAITRTAPFQNYNVGISAGNDNARYRISVGYMDQQGIVRKSGLKKYTANINGGLRFLESKRLGLDINIVAGQTVEDIAPVSNTAGFEGSLIGQALQWNPTRSLRNADGSLNIKGPNFPATNYNPLAFSEAYDDNAKTSNVLASFTPYYKFTDKLEYRSILSVNYATGIRRSQLASFINVSSVENRGWAQYGSNELLTKQATHLLNYNTSLATNNTLSATLGYEYMSYDNKGVTIEALDFPSQTIPYTNLFEASTATNRQISSFADPSSELQSFFGRVNVNLADRFNITATMRADGSSKFGENNKYGYFPSIGVAWNVGGEDFMQSFSAMNLFKLRLSWGKTGNQEFPAGAAQEIYAYEGPGRYRLINVANPDLKWETTTTTNAGIDFAFMQNRITGSLDYYHRNTKDLLFNFFAIAPAPAGRVWSNVDGTVVNSGLEISLDGVLIAKKDLTASVGVRASFLKNELRDYVGAPILTGQIHGQGLSGASAQKLENGQPINSFFIGQFTGLDRNGVATFTGGDPNVEANKYFAGDPNPNTILGLTGNLLIKRLGFNFNMNGAFGQQVYNNTVQAALAIGNIGNNRNIARSVYNPAAKEDRANSQPVSDRYLEDGSYMKLANATLSYNLGNLTNTFRNATISLTGQNLFVLTDYSGFDPEVNTPKAIDEVPSFGIEYTPYPTARSFILSFNVSF